MARRGQRSSDRYHSRRRKRFRFFTDFRNLNENDKHDYGAFAKNFSITAISDETISYIENGKAETASAGSTLYLTVNYDKSNLLSFHSSLYV